MTSDPVRLTPILNDGIRGRQDLFWRMRRPRLPAHWYAAVLILHLILTVLFCMKTFVSAILAPNSFLVGILFDIPAGFFEDRLERLRVPQDVSTQQCVGCEYLAGPAVGAAGSDVALEISP